MLFTFHSLTLMWFCISAFFVFGENQKRILLNDPTYIQQQLDHLQIEVQSLQVESNAQKSMISSQQSTIVKLQAELAAQQKTISSQQSTIINLQADVAAQKRNISTQQSTISSPEATTTSFVNGRKGTYFTIWGRTACPHNITVVYSGYAGGSNNTHTGAAADYTCMPQDPIWGPHKNVQTTYIGYMFGAEYEGSATVWGMKDYTEDVSCAVCETFHFSMAMMIPGRTQCYSGWTEAYHGNLATGYYTDKAASQYVCVDQHPQALAGGGNHDDNGKLFFPVKAKCGSLKCPPYEEEKILSCVVCMK